MDKLENVELEAMIKDVAKKLNIAPYPIDEIKRKVNGYYDSNFTYVTSGWKIWYDSYIEACIVWSLNDIRKENPIENQMYLELERAANRTGASEPEKKRAADIVSMLSTQGIFPKDEKSFYTLHEVMQWLDSDQQQALVDAILCLKDYCDAEGVISVLESADVNGIKDVDRVLIQNPNDTGHRANSIKPMADAFITRLGLMTRYVERVATKTYNDKRFCDEVWIRSTGSDPHCDGEHALFW